MFIHHAPLTDLRRRRGHALPTRPPFARLGAAALAGVLLTGCGSSSAPTPVATPSSTSTDIEIAPELLAPLVMLGPCSEVADPGLDQEVPGLELPEGAFLTSVTEQNGLVNVRGYVNQTPIVFQLGFREREDLEMISVENEIQESETLYSDGHRRVFLKAAAVCELGSLFIAAIAEDVNADTVPTPSGSPTPQG